MSPRKRGTIANMDSGLAAKAAPRNDGPQRYPSRASSTALIEMRDHWAVRCNRPDAYGAIAEGEIGAVDLPGRRFGHDVTMRQRSVAPRATLGAATAPRSPNDPAPARCRRVIMV